MPPVRDECPPFIEWDERKRLLNILKHGLDLADGWRVFAGPYLAFLDDRRDYGETRWISIGKLGPHAVVVVHAEREGFIRLISMRKANERERKRYQKRLGAP